MLDSFKRVRTTSTRALRRATLSTMIGPWGAMLAPSKSAKRKVKQTAKAIGKSEKATLSAVKQRDSATRVKLKTTATLRTKILGQRGSFKTGTHESVFGTRSYKFYVPSLPNVAPDPLPLIVMLHGCGQSPDDFARGTGMNALAEVFGFIVLYPAPAPEEHLSRCWNWFKRGDQTRGAGEPSLIAGLTRKIIVENNVDPAKVYIAGLSAGGAAALIVASAYPDIFAAVGFIPV